MKNSKLTDGILGLAMGSVLSMTAGGALAAPIPFSGGQIDSERLKEGEIYLSQPKPAVAPKGCEIAEKYVTLQNAGHYDKVAELFTPDAIFLEPSGVPAMGRAAINDFYTVKIKKLDVHIVPVSYTAAPGMCLVQLAIARMGSKTPTYYSAAIDQFFLAPDGRARMMMPYGRATPIVRSTVEEMSEK